MKSRYKSKTDQEKVLQSNYLLFTDFSVGESKTNMLLVSSIPSIAIYIYYLMFIFLHYLMELILPVREIGKALDYMKAVPNIYGTQIIHICAKKKKVIIQQVQSFEPK